MRLRDVGGAKRQQCTAASPAADTFRKLAGAGGGDTGPSEPGAESLGSVAS